MIVSSIFILATISLLKDDMKNFVIYMIFIIILASLFYLGFKLFRNNNFFNKSLNDNLVNNDANTTTNSKNINSYTLSDSKNSTQKDPIVTKINESTKRQLDETLKLIESTKNPDTYFLRCDFLIDTLTRLQMNNEYNDFKYNYDEITMNFINRYVIDLELKIKSLKNYNAKINNINKYYDNLLVFKDKISDKNLNEFSSLIGTIRKQVENPYIDKNNPAKSNNKLISISDFIPAEIRELIWFIDGPFKNLEMQNHYTYESEFFTITIETNSNEPSAISVNLSVEAGKDNENIGYYPSYERLKPIQRYKYLNWLKDISKPIDIGYVFIFYYGLERHILMGEYLKAVKIISRLQTLFDNGSFLYYSNNALFLASIIHKDEEILKYINLDKLDPVLLITIKTLYELPITPDDIIFLAPSVGWKNKRYIKMYPELFKDTMENLLIEKFNQKYYIIDKNKYFSVEESHTLTLANYSFDYKDRAMNIPNILTEKTVSSELFNLLETTHETVKKVLAEKRKNKNK